MAPRQEGAGSVGLQPKLRIAWALGAGVFRKRDFDPFRALQVAFFLLLIWGTGHLTG